MTAFAGGLVLVVGVTFLGAVVAWFTHHRFGMEDSDNPAVGAVLTLVGGVQAVLMMFVLIALFDNGADARTGTYTEADALVSVSWSANALPEPARTRIHELAQEYATTVADTEWQGLRDATPTDDRSLVTLTELRRAIDDTTTTSDWQEDRRAEAADAAWDVYEARQARLELAGGGVNAVVWLALLAGGLATVVLTYLFDALPRPAYLVTTAMVAGTMTLVLYVIFQLQNPFAGGAAIEPDAFRTALGRLG
jgi:hypothetical protein